MISWSASASDIVIRGKTAEVDFKMIYSPGSKVSGCNRRQLESYSLHISVNKSGREMPKIKLDLLKGGTNLFSMSRWLRKETRVLTWEGLINPYYSRKGRRYDVCQRNISEDGLALMEIIVKRPLFPYSSKESTFTFSELNVSGMVRGSRKETLLKV